MVSYQSLVKLKPRRVEKLLTLVILAIGQKVLIKTSKYIQISTLKCGIEVVKEVEKKVTVSEKNSTVTVDFNLDTTNLKGKQLVAFEEWYDANGVLVAEHKDINDKGQTVEIKSDIPNTGDVSNIMGYGSLLIIAGALVLVIKRRKSNKL